MNTPTLGVSTETGLDISGVIYNYTAVKEKEDDFTVTVGNEDLDGGYIWKDTEDWSNKYGIKIRKFIPIPYTPIELFGKGSIATTGTGTVEDASVIYMYRWDLCRNAQNDKSCPNYIPPLPVIPKFKIYDALEDEFVKDATEETDGVGIDKDEEVRETEEDDEEKERLEIAMAASENALTIANTASQASLLKTINQATNINSYYVAQISGGVYRDTTSLPGGKIVDNNKMFRSLGQDKLMDQMIGAQYK
tara:strand:+ start:408 stop:1154 length:747 start_codon:yes stop_codon:yes gene_type:complete